MKILRIVFLFLLTLQHANAEQKSIILEPLKGEQSLDLVNTINVSGRCGNSVIRILGIKQFVDGSYIFEQDAEKIIIRSNSGELMLDSKAPAISDFNGISCIPTKLGVRLIIRNACGGSLCGDEYRYFIYDPEKLSLIFPKNVRSDTCDLKCATNILGKRPF